MPRVLLFGIFCLLTNASLAQSPAGWLEQARAAYRSDQLDSSAVYYQLAFDHGASPDQIEALTGLVKVSILQAELAKADSLLKVGEKILQQQSVPLGIQCRFKTARGEFLRKNSQFEAALRQHLEVVDWSKNLQEDQEIYAYALYYTALTYERLEDYDSTIFYVDQAYDLFRQHLDTTSLEFAGIYNGLGVCYYRANRFPESKQFYLKSKKIAETKLGPISTDLAICLNNLSSISRAEENYPEAIEYSEEALRISKALKDEAGAASAYYSLGVYHYFLGDYGRTKDYMEACIAIRERIYAPDHYSLIGPYEVLGIALEESGQYEKTLHYLRKVRKIIQANYPPESMVEGYNYENTAICFKQTDQLDSALFYIQQSNQILPKQLTKQDQSLGIHYFTYADILFQQGALHQSMEMLQHSNSVYLAQGLGNSTEFTGNLSLEGLILAEQQDWHAADARFEAALSNVRLSAPTEELVQFKMNPNTLSLLNHYIDYLYRKYQATGQAGALKDFEHYSEVYLDLSDRFRKQFIDPYTKSILIKDNAEVYDRSIGIYHRLFLQSQDPQYLRAAYRFSEYGRTCMLRDLQDDKVQHYAGVPDSVLARERALQGTIAQLSEALINKPEDEQLKQALLQQKGALSAHIEQTLQSYPRYHDLKFNSNVPDLAWLQQQLAPGEHFIEFMQDDTAYYALVIHTNQYHWHHLANRKAVDKQIAGWKSALQSRDAKSTQLFGEALYKQLWQPMEASLDGERITIIPVGPLFHLNFETLPTQKADAPFLIHQYTISYALSLTVLFSVDPPRPSAGMMAVAPGFEPSIKQAYRQSLDSLAEPDQEFLQTVRQPWSLRTVEALQKQFRLQAYTGLEATESNLKAKLAHSRFLYFGTHAIADAADPLRSKLVLAKEVGSQQEDGYLHAYELFGIPLAAELAILNACESGLGNLQKGEGMISLAYSMHFAGCPSTVMSLWKVDEKVSTSITLAFIKYLEKGYSKSEALRRAKLEYLSEQEGILSHPFYWGGLVLMGKDGAIELPQASWWRSPWWWLGISCLVLLLVWLLRRRI